MKSRIYIEAFDCVTSTGANPELFWSALDQNISGVGSANVDAWPVRFQKFWSDQNHSPISCTIKNHLTNATETLSTFLSTSALKTLTDVNPSSKMGIIFSSTKGAIEDFVWEENLSDDIDPLNIVLVETIKKLPTFTWTLKQVVSNSCASSHASIALAQKWIEAGACDKVLIIAGDLIGPFIHSGFQTLKALSGEMARPFQDERDGLVLGEAMTAILLSNKESEFELLDCQIFNEAHTVTGASPEGRGLLECIKRLRIENPSPDFAIAHGTATQLNDQIEDLVLSKTQKLFDRPFYITGTKWSVGHTLGASGSVDLIAAMMSLRHQKVFSLNAKAHAMNTQCQAQNYMGEKSQSAKLESALITSLGFGGTNGALIIKRHAL
jgi:hypothetical protein